MKKRTLLSPIICILALGFGGDVFAQKWSEVGDPYASRQIYHASAFDSKLWILDDGDVSGNKAQSLRLKTWDEASWKTYPEFQLAGVDSIHGQFTYGVDTSMYVSYQYFSGGISRAGLLRFDIPGENWVNLSSVSSKLGDGSEIRTMTWFENELYLGGLLIDLNGTTKQLIRLIPQFQFAEVYGTVQGAVNYLASYQGTLYFGGEFDSIGGLPIKNLAMYSAGVFSQYRVNAGKTVFLKAIAQDALAFQEEQNPQLKFLNYHSAAGDMVLNADFPDDFFIHDLDQDKGQHFSIQYSNKDLYPAGVYHLNTAKNSWERMNTLLDPMRSIFVHTGKFLYLVELSSNSYHIEKNALAYFTGRLFVDIDGDCAKTMGDRMLDQHVVVKELNSDRHWLAKSGTGIFGGYESEGLYEIELGTLPPRLSAKVCNWGNKFQLNAGDSVHYNIPLSIVDTSAAVRITLTAEAGFRARQGFEENYVLQIYNEGFRPQVCPVYVSFPEQIQFTGADIMPFDSLGNGVYIWKVAIAPFQKTEVNLKGSVDLLTPAYTKVRMEAWSEPACLRYDNRDSLVMKVVGAFDPNDKQNFPEGHITPKTTNIRYHIRFQNTGTDTAINVTVIDTLDIKLPLAWVRLRAFSHEFSTFQFTSDYAQIWTFTDIMLPDSGVDMAGSNGFITYDVGLHPNNTLRHGDSIVNTAYIYFDYQKAVVTNTVKNEMQKEESADPPIAGPNDPYLVYPNPSRGNFSVVNFTGTESICTVYDAQGKNLGSWNLAAEGETAIDLSRYSMGVYYLKFPEWNAQESIIISR
ncbi:MAG TPA: hypothetical protein DIW47_06925 [Bacteroidetes bacterium]|nr:hypothetical protein [Bacteroidota bacterium]